MALGWSRRNKSKTMQKIHLTAHHIMSHQEKKRQHKKRKTPKERQHKRVQKLAQTRCGSYRPDSGTSRSCATAWSRSWPLLGPGTLWHVGQVPNPASLHMFVPVMSQVCDGLLLLAQHNNFEVFFDLKILSVLCLLDQIVKP